MLQLQSQMSGPGTGSEAEAAKYSKLCKDVRKQLIEEIMKKHRWGCGFHLKTPMFIPIN